MKLNGETNKKSCKKKKLCIFLPYNQGKHGENVMNALLFEKKSRGQNGEKLIFIPNSWQESA